MQQCGPDALLITDMVVDEVRAALDQVDSAITIFGFGRAMEVFKSVGPAGAVCERYGVGQMSGYQALGHTRMATESAVTVADSHPFCPAADLALVHNGSFSNYASLRRELRMTASCAKQTMTQRWPPGSLPLKGRVVLPWKRRSEACSSALTASLLCS